ncbi:MAG: hypothetical protein ACKPCM_10670, partial [Pseudanabaena sp.]
NQGVGRFTRSDVWEGNISNPISFNKYLYANSNPINFTDPSGRFSIAELSAAESIRNVLAGIQADAGSYLISATLKGGNYGISDFFTDLAWNLFFSLAPNVLNFDALKIGGGGISGGSGINQVGTSLHFAEDTIRVYRVEGGGNTRILVGQSGEIVVQGNNMLFLNFGQRGRAEEFLQQRLGQGFSDTVVKSFEVPKSYVDELRNSAVPERLAKQFPSSPIVVDTTKAPDQYGLRPTQLDQLRNVIIQGSGVQSNRI